MTERVAYEGQRYAIYSEFRPRGVPAGRYEDRDKAVAHTETVTYKMWVWDQQKQTIDYRNWDEKGEADA